jgi:hypothetical protein
MGQEALDRSETIPERNDRQCTAPRSVEYEFEDEHEIAHRTVFRNCERVAARAQKRKSSQKNKNSNIEIEDCSTRRPLATNLFISHAEVAEERGGFFYVEPIDDRFNSLLRTAALQNSLRSQQCPRGIKQIPLRPSATSA